MSHFIQLHILTTYGAANLNRDDTGRPKTLRFGGSERLRISSQSLKRAFRTSDVFASHVADALGKRSSRFMGDLVARLIAAGIDPDVAEERAEAIINVDHLGKPRKDKRSQTEQLVHLGPDELQEIEALAERLSRPQLPDLKTPASLKSKPRAVDIAMFGRMLADNPAFNVEAAVQVAHAFTTHTTFVEEDFFTAIDDLQPRDAETRGAGFIGIGQYGAGTFYLYVCINADLLLDNLSGDRALAKSALTAMIEAAARVSPTGKQNSYASRAAASYIVQEIGTSMPRSLGAAFQVPVGQEGERDYLAASIARLTRLRDGFARAYGEAFETSVLDVTDPDGLSLMDLSARASTVIDRI